MVYFAESKAINRSDQNIAINLVYRAWVKFCIVDIIFLIILVGLLIKKCGIYLDRDFADRL